MLRRVAVVPLLALAVLAALALPAGAQSPQLFAADATRYMALGDSISAGYKALPATDGYPYLLYKDGVFDRLPHTLFCNASVPGATSADVLAFQVPQALIPAAAGGFSPKYVTLTAGGNDLLGILAFAQANPTGDILGFAQHTLQQYGQNLGQILGQLHAGLPGVKIFVSNQYPLAEIQALFPFTDQVIDAFNQVTAQVVAQVPGAYLVDVHSAFLGRSNLVEGERGNTSPAEVHPTNVGQRVIEKAFADVIAVNK